MTFNIQAQEIPRPSDVFGFKVGTDYKAANYEQELTYFKQLDEASNRVKLVNIGKTTLGRPMILLIISSKENMQQLDHWRSISEKMARARIDSAQARKLSREGKAIVWIDGGMHASEMAHGQMTPLLAYRVATEETPEMQHIRKNVILLLMPVINPDGMDMVVSWYKSHLGTPYETSSLPWLWQKYVGHDNNRDYFMANLPETKNILKVEYQMWYPQIVLNQHQEGSGWAWQFIPPFKDPVNQNINPGVTAGVNAVGSAMAQRFAMKDMPGYISRTSYTMYWDGGGREVPYYHNMIGLLTEATHNYPTPRYFDPEKRPKRLGGFPNDSTAIFNPDPWLGGTKHFGTAIKYMMTSSIATLRYSADRKTNLLWNIYNMGREAIHEGKTRAPYAYVVPKKQWDPWEAKDLINILYRGGIEIKKATDSFTAGGNRYDAGSYIIYSAQAFLPYVKDLLEKQIHPVYHQYPGGPVEGTYDITGWTLPMQMGVAIDQIAGSFNAPAKDITGLIDPAPGDVQGDAGYGYALSPKSNAAVMIVNQLLADGADVSRAFADFNVNGNVFSAGTYLITNVEENTLDDLADQFGMSFYGLSSKPDVGISKISQPKIGLYKSWRASSDEGWTEWLLKATYHFKVDTLHDANVRKQDLSQYTSIILPSQRPSAIFSGYSIQQMPKKYTGGLGIEGTHALHQYVENGGTLIAFDAASDFVIKQFNLPVRNAVQGLSTDQFFIPGSLIRTTVDTGNPLAWGMQDTVAVTFEASRAFSIGGGFSRYRSRGKNVDAKPAPTPKVDVVARYADSNLLMSGEALNAKKYIGGKPAMVRIPYGEGQIVLFAFRPQFRGQPRGTFKLIFNAIYSGSFQK